MARAGFGSHFYLRWLVRHECQGLIIPHNHGPQCPRRVNRCLLSGWPATFTIEVFRSMSDKIPEQICLTIENHSYVPSELLEQANDKIDDLRRKLAKAIATINDHKKVIPLVAGTLALDLDNPLADGLEMTCLEKSILVATIRREHKIRLELEKRVKQLEYDTQ